MKKNISHIFHKKANNKSAKKIAMDWAMRHLDGIAVYNSQFSNYIEFNKKGIKKTLSKNEKAFADKISYRHFIYSVIALKKITSQARYVSKEKHRHGDENISVHIFHYAFEIEGKKYNVKIVVREIILHKREGLQKRFFYNHSFIV